MGFDNVDGNSSDCDICIEFSLYNSNSGEDVYVAETQWKYDSENYFGGGGYVPEDALGIYFDDNYWEFAEQNLYDTTYTYGDHVFVQDDDLIEGVGWEVDDKACGDGNWKRIGLYLATQGDYNKNERWVASEYIHTWNDTDVDMSVGVDSDYGVSLVFNETTETKTEKTSTEGDGATIMKLDQANLGEAGGD